MAIPNVIWPEPPVDCSCLSKPSQVSRVHRRAEQLALGNEVVPYVYTNAQRDQYVTDCIRAARAALAAATKPV